MQAFVLGMIISDNLDGGRQVRPNWAQPPIPQIELALVYLAISNPDSIRQDGILLSGFQGPEPKTAHDSTFAVGS